MILTCKSSARMRKRSGPHTGSSRSARLRYIPRVCGKDDKMGPGAVSLEEYTARAHLLIAK